jgi:hypothetical protein
LIRKTSYIKNEINSLLFLQEELNLEKWRTAKFPPTPTSVHESGEGKKARISKRRSNLIRSCSTGEPCPEQGTIPQVRSIYQRLKEKGAPEKKARVAAAHKLLLSAHAIYKKGVPTILTGQRGLT